MKKLQNQKKMQARNADFSNSFLIFFKISRCNGFLAKQNAEKNELLRRLFHALYEQVYGGMAVVRCQRPQSVRLKPQTVSRNREP